jgi:DNA-nicking Smr family endonuclease
MFRRLVWWLFSRAARPPAPPPDDAPNEEHVTDEDGENGENAVALPLEEFLDLHAFSPREIASVVEEYLRAAHQAGFREVRLIHGKGKGVQRRIVQSLLARHPLVESFSDAPAHRGGWGATLAWLCPSGEAGEPDTPP